MKSPIVCYISFILAIHLVEAALQCYECSSGLDGNCAAPNPNASKDRLTTTCPDDVTKCFIEIKNEKIRRGCLFDENANVALETDSNSESIKYQTCLTSMCNDDAIAKEFCIICDSESDSNCQHDPSTEMTKQCLLSIKQQGCLLYLNQTGYVRRDCMSTDEELRQLCLNEDECKYCFGDECNKQRYFTMCNSCSSRGSLNNNCMTSPWITKLQTCQKYVDDCYTHIDDMNTISRGCFSTFPTDKLNCTNSDTCLRCTGDGDNSCNSIAIKSESCITCDSSDSNCKDNVTSKMLKKCQLSTKLMGCYHFDENDEVKRGCISDVKDENFRKLCETSKNILNRCVGSQKCLTGSHFNSQSIGKAIFESISCTIGTDECFTHVKNNVIRKGCLSDANALLNDGIDIKSDCNSSDICEKCSGTIDCNNKIVEKEFCMICNSKDDPSCENSLSNLMRHQCPLSVRPLGCLLFNNGTTVKRDCMSTDSELRELCLADGESCKYCFGDECNKEHHFAQCYSCNSAQDGKDCVTAPWKTEMKTCSHYLDECFTHINNDGVVMRGCFDDFKSDEENCTSEDTCQRCNERIGCNNVSLIAESCISCDSNDNPNCKSNAKADNSVICPLKTVQPQGCYHFISEIDEHTRRGCVTSLSSEEQRVASEQPNQLKYCHGSENCNSRTTFTKCYTCNSTTDPDCISNPIQLGSLVKFCNDYDDSCFSHIRSHSVVRGCLSDLPSESIARCRTSPEKCDICQDENGQICNDIKFSDVKCISCDSNRDERCRTEPELLSQKLCGLANSPNEDLSCYLIRDSNDIVKRGCVSDFTAEDQQNCLNSVDQCKTCKGDICNQKVEFQHCYECTSRSDTNCAQANPLSALTICPDYMDECLMAIDSDGFTVRQCFSNQTENLSQFQMHNLCEKNQCNGQIFPENRLQCFQCKKDRTCDRLVTNENVPLEKIPCNFYSKSDKCFMYMDDEHDMHRGCLSDLESSRSICEKQSYGCVTCAENGCNNRTLTIQPTLKCHKCNDTTDCTFGLVNQNTIVDCTFPVVFGTEESCYIRRYKDGIIERGCTIDEAVGEPDWCKDLDTCDQCKGHACNNENIQFSFCLQCNSTENIECREPLNATETFNTKCVPIRNNVMKSSMYDPYSYTERGCYTINKDDKIERGCLIDLTDAERDECKTNVWCKTCETKNCNDEGFPSTANELKSFSFLICLIATLIHYARMPTFYN